MGLIDMIRQYEARPMETQNTVHRARFSGKITLVGGTFTPPTDTAEPTFNLCYPLRTPHLFDPDQIPAFWEAIAPSYFSIITH